MKGGRKRGRMSRGDGEVWSRCGEDGGHGVEVKRTVIAE